MSPDAFFAPDGEHLVATELTRGPWDPRYMHGGPPAALLARAVERAFAAVNPAVEGRPPSQVARLTVEFLRPVPIGRVEVGAQIARAGRKVQHATASLSVDGTEVCRATALLIRTTEVELPPAAEAPPPPLAPSLSSAFTFPFFMEPVGYHTAMEARLARGDFGHGPTQMWMRMRQPLVAGEAPSPLQRTVVAADSGNGVSLVLDHALYTFLNPDLTVYLGRLPVGEWICLDAATAPHEHGIGIADTRLHDERGVIGRSVQSLVVERR